MAAQRDFQRELTVKVINSTGDSSMAAEYALEAVLGLLVIGGLGCSIPGGRMIRSRAAHAANVAERIASGDLAGQIGHHGRDEFAPLLAAMQRMQPRLVEVVGSVQTGAREVVVACGEITHGNADLSAGTESQAASLERTAASMDQMSSTVKHNAETTRHVKRLISDSVEKVKAGTWLVGEAGTTMGEVVSQVRRVAELIIEISAATGEQCAGIAQVTQAVTQLDSATQQNAQLVRRSADAATSLHEQADRLVQSVRTNLTGFHQLASGTGGAAPDLASS